MLKTDHQKQATHMELNSNDKKDLLTFICH